jgi:hypothetical protein
MPLPLVLWQIGGEKKVNRTVSSHRALMMMVSQSTDLTEQGWHEWLLTRGHQGALHRLSVNDTQKVTEFLGFSGLQSGQFILVLLRL